MSKMNDLMKTDPRMNPERNPMPFDGKRMIFGGFAPVVTLERQALRCRSVQACQIMRRAARPCEPRLCRDNADLHGCALGCHSVADDRPNN
jgi:hypothetical protein